MNTYTTTWNKQELSAYLLLYCANADFIETNKEIDFIRSKVDLLYFKPIHDEFEKDNDYQSIQKIQSTLNRLNFEKAQKDELIEEIKDLFLADGDYNQLELTLFIGLKKILDF